MSGALPALLSGLAFLIALRGMSLLRDLGPVASVFAGADSRIERRGPLTRLVESLGERFGPRLYGRLGERRRRRAGRLLVRAGNPGGMTVRGYANRKAALTSLGAGAGALVAISGGGPACLALGAGSGWIGLDLWLDRRGRARQGRIERDLPDFLDIIAVTVAAGLGYRAALGRVAAGLGGPLGEEIDLVLREIELGRSRREAFEQLARRNDCEPLARFVTAQLQAEELGVPLGEAIGDIAEEMRRETYQAARRRAQRASPRVSLIVTATIAPASLILIVAGLIIGTDLGLGGSI